MRKTGKELTAEKRGGLLRRVKVSFWVPPWAHWVATDSYGHVYAFLSKPKQRPILGIWQTRCGFRVTQNTYLVRNKDREVIAQRIGEVLGFTLNPSCVPAPERQRVNWKDSLVEIFED